MRNRLLNRGMLAVILAATTLLGGCYVAPYGYYPRYGYAAPVVVGGGYYRPYYYR